MIYGPAFSPAVIEATTLPVVSRDLLPWLRKDRREAVEGSYRVSISKDGHVREHDRMGLDYAVKDLHRIERDLKEATGNRAVILGIQLVQQRAAVQFWEGKITLLDRVIAATQAQP